VHVEVAGLDFFSGTVQRSLVNAGTWDFLDTLLRRAWYIPTVGKAALEQVVVAPSYLLNSLGE
jgi:hypothetical protein